MSKPRFGIVINKGHNRIIGMIHHSRTIFLFTSFTYLLGPLFYKAGIKVGGGFFPLLLSRNKVTCILPIVCYACE